jgi:hypothetical protein
VLQRGGHGGRRLPSEGNRRVITMKTVQVHADSRLKSTHHLLLTTHRLQPTAYESLRSLLTAYCSLLTQADSMVKTLLDPSYVAGDQGAPPWVGDILATVISRTLPKGMEFARFSIDYHYLRNQVRPGGEARAEGCPLSP